jgi:hypothetical protein
MIIHIDAEGSVRLDEPDTFTSFSVRAPGLAVDEVVETLAGDGYSCDDEHVWVAISRLHTLGDAAGGESWRAGCDGMLEYAASKGWIDESRNAVRAHLER